MKEGDGLNDILGNAHLVEGNQHSEHLSKVYLDSVKPSKLSMQWTRRQIRSSKEDPSHDGIKSQNLGPSPETIRRDAVIVVPSTCLSIALCLGKNVTIVKRKTIFLICVEAGNIARAMTKVSI